VTYRWQINLAVCDRGDHMLERLGNVLYWVTCGAAAFIVKRQLSLPAWQPLASPRLGYRRLRVRILFIAAIDASTGYLRNS
jgi:hypothetical protein